MEAGDPWLGQYRDFSVSADGVRQLVEWMIEAAGLSDRGAVFAQLGVEGCACGTNLLCATGPPFRFTLRLSWILKRADLLQQIAGEFEPTYDGSSWSVTFYRESDPIAGTLYAVLRRICGCEDGAISDAYFPDPSHWNANESFHRVRLSIFIHRWVM